MVLEYSLSEESKRGNILSILTSNKTSFKNYENLEILWCLYYKNW